MDYIPPPPPVYESAYIQGEPENRFMIKVDQAEYDQDNMQAVIAMQKALQKSHRIESYNGDWITLVYKDSMPKLKSCPVVQVPVQDIRRNIDFIENQVTLTISNIPQNLADQIQNNLCLLIDTYTVKKVSNPDFELDDNKVKYN